MQIHIENGWTIFCIAFTVLLITTYIFQRLGKNFYTMDVVLRRFSIIDLEWPATPLELQNLLQGIYKLPDDKRVKAISSLKKSLLVDYLFMPAAYGCIFLLCMKISWKMSYIGPMFFATLAWLQVIAYVLDILENIYLWQKIKPNMKMPGDAMFSAVRKLELLKWGIPFFSLMCALSSVLYYWLVGLYSKQALMYVSLVIIEIFIFIFFVGIAGRKKQQTTS